MSVVVEGGIENANEYKDSVGQKAPEEDKWARRTRANAKVSRGRFEVVGMVFA
jgi:hypothetical protein